MYSVSKVVPYSISLVGQIRILVGKCFYWTRLKLFFFIWKFQKPIVLQRSLFSIFFKRSFVILLPNTKKTISLNHSIDVKYIKVNKRLNFRGYCKYETIHFSSCESRNVQAYNNIQPWNFTHHSFMRHTSIRLLLGINPTTYFNLARFSKINIYTFLMISQNKCAGRRLPRGFIHMYFNAIRTEKNIFKYLVTKYIFLHIFRDCNRNVQTQDDDRLSWNFS